MSGVTTVTVSLPSLIEELKSQLPAHLSPKLDTLLSHARDSPSLHAHVKQQMSEIASPAQLRAAVNALIDKAAAVTPEPARGSDRASSSSDLPPQLVALFGDISAEDFKACLIHAFHCRTPSCPVPGCATMAAKIERLHAHVAGCGVEGCVLCRIWTYLKHYRTVADGGGLAGGGSTGSAAGAGSLGTAGLCQTLYVEPLLKSSQLLPRLKDGQIAWVPAADALAQLQELTSLPGAAGAAPPSAPAPAAPAPPAPHIAMQPQVKRQKLEGAPAAEPAAALPPWGMLLPEPPAGPPTDGKDALAALEQQLADAHARLPGVPLAASASLQSLAQSVLPGLPLS
eukprot:scaffold23204_cov23-Tisochrysis_lutea.AAC.1